MNKIDVHISHDCIRNNNDFNSSLKMHLFCLIVSHDVQIMNLVVCIASLK